VGSHPVGPQQASFVFVMAFSLLNRQESLYRHITIDQGAIRKHQLRGQ
jgi:hypothetical protein